MPAEDVMQCRWMREDIGVSVFEGCVVCNGWEKWK